MQPEEGRATGSTLHIACGQFHRYFATVACSDLLPPTDLRQRLSCGGKAAALTSSLSRCARLIRVDPWPNRHAQGCLVALGRRRLGH